jgi:hypothetical protein
MPTRLMVNVLTSDEAVSFCAGPCRRHTRQRIVELDLPAKPRAFEQFAYASSLRCSGGTSICISSSA